MPTTENAKAECFDGSRQELHTTSNHGTPAMKLYGYSDEGPEPAQVVPYTLAEVTLVATPRELRRIARFLSECADEMDQMGKTYDHVYLSDRDRIFNRSPHFVVMRASSR